MRIAGKVYFRRMSLTKSLLLEVHWSCKTCLKPTTTHTLSHKYSNFDLVNKKLEIKTQNSEINKTPQYLLGFERKPWFVGRSGDLF